MSQKTIFRICSVILGLSGLAIIFSTLYPIVSYEWESYEKYPTLISSLVDEETASFRFEETDYTNIKNWEEAKDNEEGFNVAEVKYYSISIPELNIHSATVAVGGDDLSEYLIQYPGTSNPGEIGNAVIFGHSILPIYYDPENYLAIFSTLPTLEKGDEIYVDHDGINYGYIVEDMFEVKPKDIQILEQSKGGSYLTLVTCTPPGHPLKPKRLIVRAKLVQM